MVRLVVNTAVEDVFTCHTSLNSPFDHQYIISTKEDNVMKKGRSKNEPFLRCMVEPQERLREKIKKKDET